MSVLCEEKSCMLSSTAFRHFTCRSKKSCSSSTVFLSCTSPRIRFDIRQSMCGLNICLGNFQIMCGSLHCFLRPRLGFFHVSVDHGPNFEVQRRTSNKDSNSSLRVSKAEGIGSLKISHLHKASPRWWNAHQVRGGDRPDAEEDTRQRASRHSAWRLSGGSFSCAAADCGASIYTTRDPLTKEISKPTAFGNCVCCCRILREGGSARIVDRSAGVDHPSRWSSP